MRDTLAALMRNPLSLVGSGLAQVSAVLFAALLLIEIFGAQATPVRRDHHLLVVARGRETITAACDVCHTVVAWDEANPEILEMIPD
jgi:hypothetical protein